MRCPPPPRPRSPPSAAPPVLSAHSGLSTPHHSPSCPWCGPAAQHSTTHTRFASLHPSQACCGALEAVRPIHLELHTAEVEAPPPDARLPVLVPSHTQQRQGEAACRAHLGNSHNPADQLVAAACLHSKQRIIVAHDHTQQRVALQALPDAVERARRVRTCSRQQRTQLGSRTAAPRTRLTRPVPGGLRLTSRVMLSSFCAPKC